jgi:LAS superfamily LD-carboxypeptidase LdcB
MRSLVDLFTGGGETDILPGLRELNKVTPGSFRTYNQQVNAAATNPYAADPGYSYHQQGLAIDFGWANQYDALIRALGQSGWNQFDRGYEPWHWSYGVTG